MSGILSITLKWARRCVIAVVGGTVVLIGICMVVLPGPAIVVIPAGLAILGLEFAWARACLKKVREGGDYASARFRKGWPRRGDNGTPP